MQRVQSGALFEQLPAGSELWIDGGHNGSAGLALASALADLHDRASMPLALICGMLSTKDPAAFLEPFAGLASSLVAVPIRGSEAGIPPDMLVEHAADAGLTSRAAQTLTEAVACAGADGPARVVICGSLYLAGEALALLKAEPA
jgi:dihydrofolate synthase/folylpolyglutamate synthase